MPGGINLHLRLRDHLGQSKFLHSSQLCRTLGHTHRHLMLYNASKGQKPSECSYSGHYMVPWTQTCPQPKQHRNPLIHFRRTHATPLSFFFAGRCCHLLPHATCSHYLTMGHKMPPPEKKLLLARGDHSPRIIHGYFGSIRICTQNSISIGSDVFARHVCPAMMSG